MPIEEKKCAFAVQIVKADQEINNSLGTTIVVIDTRIMIRKQVSHTH